MYVCSRFPRNGVTDICELPHGCWELNLGPLKEWPVLWTVEPSLHLHTAFLLKTEPGTSPTLFKPKFLKFIYFHAPCSSSMAPAFKNVNILKLTSNMLKSLTHLKVVWNAHQCTWKILLEWGKHDQEALGILLLLYVNNVICVWGWPWAPYIVKTNPEFLVLRLQVLSARLMQPWDPNPGSQACFTSTQSTGVHSCPPRISIKRNRRRRLEQRGEEARRAGNQTLTWVNQHI